jgi:predicted TPR repeat methyltransferase
MNEQAVLHFNLGNALVQQGRLAEALACYDQAIALQPDYGQAWCNRGNLLQMRHQIDAAVESYDRAIALNTEYADAYWNKANALLLGGDFVRGWPLYEWRWKRDSFTSPKRGFAQPLWLGQESLAGKTILLHSEQGLGDTVQFCRYVPMVAALGARVVLEVQKPLLGLVHSLPGVSEWVEKGTALPPFDFHCPLLSLPLAFNTGICDIPGAASYLSSDPVRRAHWANRLGPRTRPRIGIVWSGGAGHAHDQMRSIPLALMLQWLPDVFDYVSMQQEVRSGDRQVLEASDRVTHFGKDLLDFGDTAALCDGVDLIISVDTSVAHVAAALGKPTWVLLPYNPDWRWMLGRRDSPWYPGAVLYRQQQPADWSAVLARVASDLTGQWLANQTCPVCQGACLVMAPVDFHKSCEEVKGSVFEPSGIAVHYCVCKHCGFCFAPEIASWSPQLFAQRIYNDDYVLVDPDGADRRPRSNAEMVRAMFADQAMASVRHLDYGGGAGLLSRLLKHCFLDSKSFDPFVPAARGVVTALDQLGKFDLITAFEVFEHVPDPQELMRDLRTLLAPEGVVLFSTQLSDGHIHPGQPLTWWYASPRNGHISLFSKTSLSALAQQYGFRLISFADGLYALCTRLPSWARHLVRTE